MQTKSIDDIYTLIEKKYVYKSVALEDILIELEKLQFPTEIITQFRIILATMPIIGFSNDKQFFGNDKMQYTLEKGSYGALGVRERYGLPYFVPWFGLGGKLLTFIQNAKHGLSEEGIIILKKLAEQYPDNSKIQDAIKQL